MKVHLTQCGETELLDMMSARADATRAHDLVDSAEEADLVLMLGNFGRNPEYLLEHPAYCQFPEKCAVYSEDDNYLPLVPGVYCSAGEDRSTRVGRVFSYTYITRNGRYQNPYLSEVNKANWTEVEATTQKRYLFSFQGGSTSLVRKRLFNLQFDRRDVLIENTSNWDSFLIRVPERAISRLPELIESHIAEAADRGERAREAFEQHFAVSREFERIVQLAAQALQHGAPNEAAFRKEQPSMIRRLRWKIALRDAARSAALKAMRTLGMRNPYQMNR